MPRGGGFGGGGEYIHHITGVRMRIVGDCSLRMALYSLDDVRSFTLLPLDITASPGNEPTRLANFRSQRTSLEIKTTEMDEYFKISRIVLFVKQSATSLPG